jgi:hypothetical protein
MSRIVTPPSTAILMAPSQREEGGWGEGGSQEQRKGATIKGDEGHFMERWATKMQV